MTITRGHLSLLPTGRDCIRPLDVMFDLDGCFFWFDKAYHRGCQQVGLIDTTVRRKRAARWEFYEDYGHDLATFLANCNRLADLGLLWAGHTIPGTATIWNEIADAGHRIHVVTDRMFGSHPAVSAALTRAWLAEKRLPYTSITFTADKTAVATAIAVEDKIVNYDALTRAGTRCYLINRPWNRVPGGDRRLRIDTMDEFGDRVADMASEAA